MDNMTTVLDVHVLVFSSDAYNLDELKRMTPEERRDLAHVEMNFGYDSADILTLVEYQDLFNSGEICPESMYIFFDVDNSK